MKYDQNLQKNHEMRFYYLLIFLLLIISVFLIFGEYNTVEKKAVYTSFVVADNIGFDLNKTALTFGQFQKGGGAKRGINISNDNSYKIKAIVKVEGRIKGYLSVSDNEFYLDPGELKNLDFFVSVPEDIEAGKYDGTVNIIFKRF